MIKKVVFINGSELHFRSENSAFSRHSLKGVEPPVQPVHWHLCTQKKEADFWHYHAYLARRVAAIFNIPFSLLGMDEKPRE